MRLKESADALQSFRSRSQNGNETGRAKSRAPELLANGSDSVIQSLVRVWWNPC
jgi:hypothetical protein